MAFDLREYVKKTPIVFADIETGGTNPRKHAILTIGTVMYLQGHVYNPLYLRIKYPSYKGIVDPEALKVNKIDLEEHDSHPDSVTKGEANEIIHEYVREQRCRSVRIGGHNYTGFDRDFIKEFQHNFNDIFFGFHVDTQLLAQELVECGKLPLSRVNLDVLCAHFQIERPEAHNALDDIYATAHLYTKLKELISK